MKSPEELAKWYYEQVDQIGLTKGDCPIYYRPKDGKLPFQIFVVEYPDNKTEDQIIEYLEILKERWDTAYGSRKAKR